MRPNKELSSYRIIIREIDDIEYIQKEKNYTPYIKVSMSLYNNKNKSYFGRTFESKEIPMIPPNDKIKNYKGWHTELAVVVYMLSSV